MEKQIIYSEYDDRLLVITEDLITLISERLEGFYDITTMNRFKDLLGYLKRFKDRKVYNDVTKIIKPGSNANEIYNMNRGIMIASHNGGCIKSVYYKGNFLTDNDKDKVMIFVPCDMLRYLITKVRNPEQLSWMDTAIHEPKSIWLSTASAFHDQDSAFWNNFHAKIDAAVERAKHDNSVYKTICPVDVSSLYPIDTNKDVTFSKEIREEMDDAVERAKRGDYSDAFRYCINDILATQEFYKQLEETMRPRLRIKNVIFNDPATIVFWWDGTKTVVKCQPGDTYDPEKGLAMAICKKILGTNGSQSNFNDFFKKWLPKEEEKKEPTVIGKILDMIMTDKGLVVKGEITDPKFAPSINESLGILGE